MDLDKPSVWGSLKQRTRPLLLNLGKKKVKKSPSKPPGVRERHGLDRRLSLSVPDLLEAKALAPEGRPYSGPQSSYTSVPSCLSTAGILPKSSSSSLKQSEEQLDWSQEEAGPLPGLQTDSEEACPAAEDGRAPSTGAFGLLQQSPLGEEVPGEPEVRPRLAGARLLLFIFFFFLLSASSALAEFGHELFSRSAWMEGMPFTRAQRNVASIAPSVPLALGLTSTYFRPVTNNLPRTL